MWVAAECVPGWVMDSEHLPRVKECLSLVNSTANQLAKIPVGAVSEEAWDAGFGYPPGHTVLLSVVLLGELLDNALAGVVFSLLKVKMLSWEYGMFGKYLLQRAGWCLGELDMLGITEPAILFYVSSFDRLALRKDHSRCSDRVCLANQIDEKVYKTRHATETCTCEHIVVEEEGNRPVTEVLHRGDIPVISYDGEKVLVRSSDSTPYVAMSHVWSDGLGNPRSNSLPKCQFERIQNLVNALHPDRDPASPVPFWLDTVCVPLHLETRKTAIRRMAKTYDSAAEVLVLDVSLSGTSAGVPVDELLMRIRCTPWTQRLWTLQEGMLAEELYFQFSDKAIVAESLPDIWYEANSPIKLCTKHFGRPRADNSPLETRVFRALASDADEFVKDEIAMESALETLSRHPDCPNMLDHALLHRLDTIHSSSFHPVYFAGWGSFHRLRYRFGVGHSALPSVAGALRGRLSSKMDDETICVATLLDIDPLHILSAKGQRARMKLLVDSMDNFPPNIIFTDVPRMDLDGYRWAPESFMYKNANYAGLLRMGEPGHRTKEGLVVSNYSFYTFPEDWKFPRAGSFVVKGWESYYRITHAHALTVGVARPAVILEQPPAAISRGIVVDIWREDDGLVKFGRHVGHVSVEVLGDESAGEVVCEVVKRPISYKWCVG
ncbi:hypothetical protein C7212DRAFT_297691 [Tuber magnatum]|uniref:Heterokaryon incompatibility domain-containing protein n=1 Tax=Tuber magnatum TaxID=42249 RepID=A0A317SPA3_9PEZI|nr:hypothetical protein C7212DRAFT_297691 [Tuber magnatum]